jgi:hypothetical protein
MPPSSRPGQRGPGRRPNLGSRQQERGSSGSQQRVRGDPSLANQPSMSRKQPHGGRPPNQPGRGPNGQRHPDRGPNSAGRSAGQAGRGSKQIPSEVDRQSPPSRPEQRASPLTHKTRGLSQKLDSPTLKTATEPPPPQVSSSAEAVALAGNEEFIREILNRRDIVKQGPGAAVVPMHSSFATAPVETVPMHSSFATAPGEAVEAVPMHSSFSTAPVEATAVPMERGDTKSAKERIDEITQLLKYLTATKAKSM